MKTIMIYAVTPAIIASAALLLSFRSLSSVNIAAGLICVVGVGAVMALEYRLNWRRLLGR
jgi:hypothetical protein